jgi:hypothetical protein
MPPAGSGEQVVRAASQVQAVALVTADIIGSDRLNELLPFPASWRGDA